MFETHLSASERERLEAIWVQLSRNNGVKTVPVPADLLDKITMFSASTSSSSSSATTAKAGSNTFISPLLIEVAKMIKHLKLGDSAEKWASDMENKYAIGLIDDHCVDLSVDEVN